MNSCTLIITAHVKLDVNADGFIGLYRGDIYMLLHLATDDSFSRSSSLLNLTANGNFPR